ncbi:MAG: restriction modification system DNA specificity protein [Bacteroidetes bacterium]|nr:MAG: restriction modification system DNA specificity protein [Bacteroidota bacterium]
MVNGWIEVEFEQLVDYIQPTEFIVESTDYKDSFKIPVLTAGKSFIKGYTNETHGIFNNLPAIIFDDFTTASKYVNFPFKVKSSAMKILVPSCDLINLKYVFLGMQITDVRSDTHKRYWISDFAKKTIPLPPLNEQNRIIDKIEELFSDLDNGIDNLKLAQNQLKVYRQALLKSAFEGKLTEQWRKENNPEPAEKLLERIKVERKKRYEQELKDWKEAVKVWGKGTKKERKPSKPSAPIDYPSLKQVDIEELPVIPENWIWTRNNEILYYVTSGSRDWKKYYSDKGAFFIRTQDIKTNKLDLDGAAFVDLPINVEGKRSLVQKGDLLMTITGANVGKVAYIKDDIPESYVSQSVALMKPVNVKITPYLQLYFQSDVYGGKMISGLVYGVGRPVLSLENMREAPVVICSFEEQEQIIAEIESQFSIIENLEQTINDGIRKSEFLRQSILKKAFEGKLVAQDPNDEPAAELMKRIKAEKKKYLEEQKQQKKRTPKKIKKMSKELSIEEVLKASDKPMLAKDVWQQSKHKENIEEFYAELKKIQNSIKEVKKGTESLLSLAK